MFILKRLIESGTPGLHVDIFERSGELGTGFPYSRAGAREEHVTNVSGNEIPDLVTTVGEWIRDASPEVLKPYKMDAARYNEYKVLPRLLFGQYLSAQFQLIIRAARDAGVIVKVHLNQEVTDVIDHPSTGEVEVEVQAKTRERFHAVIISTGHRWPVKQEGSIPGYFDSPYPPDKLAVKLNHPVAVKGASLTAIDALRTLSRANGSYSVSAEGRKIYTPAAGSEDFRIVLHSIGGLLPGMRFHLEDTHLEGDLLLTEEEIAEHIRENDGFLSLDFIFEKDFKRPLKERAPHLYDRIADLKMEEFVELMMERRERLDPVDLLKAEYEEAERSIRKQESVHWKELLATLSFAMNYPAKHFSAEDMQRLRKTLSPLISIVIAFVPQSSVEEFFALHDAGVLRVVAVDAQSKVSPQPAGGVHYIYKDEDGVEHTDPYQTFVDCVGQPHLEFRAFPFQSLIDQQVISPARIRFRSTAAAEEQMNGGATNIERSGDAYYLGVSGITINDSFQVVDRYGIGNDRIYIMAVPYIGGYNPDYSGLDFGEEASGRIVSALVN